MPDTPEKNPEIIKSKEEQILENSKNRLNTINSKILELNSKSGADAFIADRIKKIDEDISKCSESMAWQLENVKKQLKEKPADYVDKIKACLQSESVKLSASIAKEPVKGGKDG
jgi:hypothetical protein